MSMHAYASFNSQLRGGKFKAAPASNKFCHGLEQSPIKEQVRFSKEGWDVYKEMELIGWVL